MPESTAPAERHLSEKIIRAVVVGGLAILSFYLNILRGIVKLGIAALKNTDRSPKK